MEEEGSMLTEGNLECPLPVYTAARLATHVEILRLTYIVLHTPLKWLLSHISTPVVLFFSVLWPQRYGFLRWIDIKASKEAFVAIWQI